MSRFWSPEVLSLEPYVPGEQPKDQNLIKLNTNENPYPPSPAVAALLKNFDTETLKLYPDPDATVLKDALAKNLSLKPEQMFLGNGSDEVLAVAFMAFFRQKEPILFPEITYSFYPVYCRLYGIEYQSMPLDADFLIDVGDYVAPNGGVIIANPNAPTSVALPLAEITLLLENNPDSVVIIDEAYVDFGGESASTLIDEFDNLLVIQTFSKSRSLAGLRIGYAMGQPHLIEGLDRVKNSFNSYPLDKVAIEAGVASLSDQAYFEESCQKIIDSRDWLTKELLEMNFEVLPSSTNFVFAAPQTAEAEFLYQQLREKGILVRYFNKPIICDYLRITVGTQAECEALVAALKNLLNKG